MITPVLDHVVLDVHTGMDEAAALYRGLGFTLTPRGRHTLGSINHLAMFATDYLELLGWPTGESSRPELRDFPLGLNGLVFKTEDADATYAHLQSVGLAATPPRAFSRPVELDGQTRDAKFRTVHLAPGEARVGRIYFCEHATPELVWRPEWQHHANGATAIHSLAIAARDPAAVAALFRAMFGEASVRTEGDRFIAAAGHPFIEIVPAPTAPRDHMTTLRLLRPGAPETIPPGRAGQVQLEFLSA